MVYGAWRRSQSGKQPGRTSREQITLFESQGLAVEDIALADFTHQNIAQ